MTRKRLVELSRGRQLLEGAAGHSACANITPALLAKLTRLNNQLKRCLSNQQIRPALSYNLNFHFSLYRASDEEVILPLIEMLWRQAGPFVALTPQDAGHELDGGISRSNSGGAQGWRRACREARYRAGHRWHDPGTSAQRGIRLTPDRRRPVHSGCVRCNVAIT
jgi:hypothetical protein